MLGRGGEKKWRKALGTALFPFLIVIDLLTRLSGLFNEFIAVNNFLIIRKVKIRFPDFVFDLYFNIPLTFATLIFRIMYFIGRIFFFSFFSKESVSHPFRMATNKFLNIRIGSKFFSKISLSTVSLFYANREERENGE